jgi:L-fucose isomerase
MQVVRGAFEHYGDEVNEALARQSTFEWPHAFTRMEVSADRFLSQFGANHIHAVPGDYLAELRQVCRLLDVDYLPLAG